MMLRSNREAAIARLRDELRPLVAMVAPYRDVPELNYVCPPHIREWAVQLAAERMADEIQQQQ